MIREMRLQEKQIRRPELISAMLDMMDTAYVGSIDGDFPYVVPVSFGYGIREEKLFIYIHCAKEGHKVDLWLENPNVSVTFSCFYNHPELVYRGRLHDFRSVMAWGHIRKIVMRKEPALVKEGLQALLRHYNRGMHQYDAEHCTHCDLWVIECAWEDVSGKMEYPVDTVEEVPFADVHALAQMDSGADTEAFRTLYHAAGFVQNAGTEDIVRSEIVPDTESRST